MKVTLTRITMKTELKHILSHMDQHTIQIKPQ